MEVDKMSKHWTSEEDRVLKDNYNCIRPKNMVELFSNRSLMAIENRKRKLNLYAGSSNEDNPNWKGNKVGYKGLHQWLRMHKPKVDLCESCKENPPFDLANISGEYKRELDNYEWLCRRCHMLKDGRLEVFRSTQPKTQERDGKGRFVKLK